MLYHFLVVIIVVYVVSALIYTIRLVKRFSIPDKVLILDVFSFNLTVFLVSFLLLLRKPVIMSFVYSLDSRRRYLSI